MGHKPRERDLDGLVGREQELNLIGAFLERTGRDGEALLLLGEAGVGKSMLLEAAAEMAAGHGRRVLSAGGMEFDADLSYAALGRVTMPLVGEIPMLSDTHRRALGGALGLTDESSPDRLLVSNAALALLSHAARIDSVLILIDDLQWLDRASAAVFGFIARRLAGTRVGFLAGSRTGEPGFFEAAGLPEHELGPLNHAAASRLLTTHFPTLAPRVRDRVLREAQGNPLALLELPAALTNEQRTARVAIPTVLPVRDRLQSVFASRVSDLPALTRRLMLLTALDRTGDIRVLRGIDDRDTHWTLTTAEQAGLMHLDELTNRLVFRHPLIRSVVVGLATPEEMRNAHRALAELVTDQPDVEAWHLAEASTDPDEHVAALLEETAQRMIRRGDAVGAVTALTRAADLSPNATERSRRLVHAAYIGGDVTGDLLSVMRLLEEAQLESQVGSSLEAATAAAWVQLTLDGNLDTAHRLLVGAIAMLGDELPAHDPSFEDALYTLEIICYFGGRAELWVAFDELLTRLGPDAPFLLDLYSRTSADPARTTRSALQELDQAIDGLSGETDPARVIRVSLTGAFLERLGACRAALWRVVEDGRRGGAIASALVALIVLGLDDFATGQWDEMQQLVDEILDLAREHGYGLQLWSGLHLSALIAAVRGDDETVRTVTDDLMQWAVPRQVQTVVRFAHHARGVAALGRGDYEQAYRHLNAISPSGTLESHVPNAMWVLLDLVEAAVGAGRHDEAVAHLRAMREHDVAALSPRFALAVAAAAAMTAPDDQAGALFAAAIASPGLERWVFDVARVQLAYGQHLRRVRSSNEARTQLMSALGTFDRIGARPWATRARNELRATGRPQAHAGGAVVLTPQEHEIAELAASGLTNKEIGARLYLSHRTVGAHLHRVFPKLGITSRAALRDALSRLYG